MRSWTLLICILFSFSAPAKNIYFASTSLDVDKVVYFTSSRANAQKTIYFTRAMTAADDCYIREVNTQQSADEVWFETNFMLDADLILYESETMNGVSEEC